ncbi:c-type cytochrome [Oryzifoliimicrobium ureilyticus]|uniref:c-type cytochrome n=1 Tax=Oryzifoliimicrobium ureilyticus TaxID=3113724 RepID=UPI0030760AC6
MQLAPTHLRDWFLVGLILTIAPLIVVGVSTVKQSQQRRAAAIALTGGDPSKAPAIFTRYGCSGCHTIPGIAGADGKVGPSLAELREKIYLAGSVNNSPENLVQWILSPQHFEPHSAMPVTGINEEEARHLAAYLYDQ